MLPLMIEALYMKKRACGLAIAVTLMLTACSGSGDIVGTGIPVDTGPLPVTFSTGVDASTRTTTGTISTLDDLKALPEGFGVFAYFTDSKLWATARGTLSGDDSNYPVPDFMYNQPVTWGWLSTVTKEVDGNIVIDEDLSVKGWTYAPLKYWPNYSDNDNAVNPRHISFFAYAPFVEGDAQTGATGLASGITEVTYGSDRSPHVRYSLGTTGDMVDLLYANCIDARRNGEGGVVVSSDGVTTDYQRVPLTFHHALCCVELYVQRIYDEQIYSGNKPDKDHTKLFVNKLVLDTGTDASKALSGSGRLNLETGQWDDDAWSRISADGDGHYKLTLDETLFNDTVRGTASVSSSDIINYELEKWERAGFGVSEQMRPLVPLGRSLMFFPQSTLTFVPTLSYTMVTRDDELEMNYITDTDAHRYNRIQHQLTGSPLTLSLQQGKRYRLVVHVGTEHISFEVAAVEDWDFPLRFRPVLPDFQDAVVDGHVLNEN